MAKETEKVHYEARLSRNISRTYYTRKVYKKGTFICAFTQKEFEKLTLKNIDNHFIPQITIGHGVAEYFDVKKDIDFVKIVTIKKTTEEVVKLI